MFENLIELTNLIYWKLIELTNIILAHFKLFYLSILTL